MNELVEKLLRPVSDAQPCGPDHSNTPAFDDLQTLLKGKPEVEIGAVKRPAEPPDWRELKDKCATYFEQSHNLRVGVMLCCSWLTTGGLPGFRDGLQLIQKLTEQYWPNFYPLLDPDDQNDPTQRLNILIALTASRGSVAGWLTIMDYLYTAPVCQPKGSPPISGELLLAARKKPAEGSPPDPKMPDPAKLLAAVRSAGNEQLAASQQALQQSLEAAQGLDQFLTKTLGAGRTMSFDVLTKALQELIAAIEPCLAGEATGGGTDGPSGGAGESPDGRAILVRGVVRSPDDVVRAIDSICEYYQQVEPSSPVPYLLRRAQKLARMDFVQAVQELNLTTIDGLRPSMGSAVDNPAPPAAS